jgi:hypothetical protein
MTITSGSRSRRTRGCDDLLTRPQVRVDEAEVGGEAVAEGEARGAEEGVGRREGAGGKLGSGAEEGVHEAVDGAGAEAGKSVGRDGEVGEKPRRVPCRGAGEFGDELLELVGTKAIEEKMRNDEVERIRGRRVFDGVRVKERDFRGWEIEGAKAILCDGEHASAGIDAGDFGGGKFLAEGGEELAGAFAEDEDGTRCGELVQVRDAGVLEFAAGQERLHPAVMRRDQIEAHAVDSAGTVEGVRFHHANAMIAPNA